MKEQEREEAKRREKEKTVRRQTIGVLASILATAVGASALRADPTSISVPNGSFESPPVPPGLPAYPTLDAWQKAPEPSWFAGSAVQATLAGFGEGWDATTGAFPNTGTPPISNMDGAQAAYMFAVPQAELYQDITGATYQAGKSYQLVVGVIGGSGGYYQAMADGTTMDIRLYYRDPNILTGDNRVTIPGADTTITYHTGDFGDRTQFEDFAVDTPVVNPSDPWNGQTIGIQLISVSPDASSLDPNNPLAEWDLDNVRLTAVPEPGALVLLAVGAGLGLLRRRR